MAKEKYVFETSEIVVQDVPLELIHTEGQTVRSAIDDDHVVELAMSISKHGLLEPIVIRGRAGGGYQLLAGFHRLAAFTRLNKKTIPSYIYKNKETPTKAIALIENIVRRDMSLDEEVKAVEYLHLDEGLSPSQICDLIGKSRDWVNKRFMIPNLPENVKQELLDGRISIAHAEIIGRIEDDNSRAYILNTVMQQKMSVRQCQELTQIYFETPSMESAVQKGEEAARQVQSAPQAFRECHLCKRPVRVWDIKFVPICMDEIDCSRAVLAEEKRREENG